MGDMGSMCCCEDTGYFDWWPLNYTDEVNPIPDSTVGLDVWDAIRPTELVLRIPVIQVPLDDPEAALVEGGWDSGDLDEGGVLFLPGGLTGPTRHQASEPGYDAYGTGAAVIAAVADQLVAHAEPLDYHYDLGAVAWWQCGLPCRNGSAYLIFGLNPGYVAMKVSVSGEVEWSRYSEIGVSGNRWDYDGETTSADDRVGVVPINAVPSPEDLLMPIAYNPGPDFLDEVPKEYPPGSRIADNSANILLLEHPSTAFAQVDDDDLLPFIGVPRHDINQRPFSDPYARVFRADGIFAGDTGYTGIPNASACWGDEGMVRISYGVTNDSPGSGPLFLGIETSYKLRGSDGEMAISSVITTESSLGATDGQAMHDYNYGTYTPTAPGVAGSWGSYYVEHDGITGIWGGSGPVYRAEFPPSPFATAPGGGGGPGWDVQRRDWSWTREWHPSDFSADVAWPAWVETLDRIPCWVFPLDFNGASYPEEWTFTADTKALPYQMPELWEDSDFNASISGDNRDALVEMRNQRIADFRDSAPHGNYSGLAEPDHPRVVYYSLDDYPRVLTGYSDDLDHYVADYYTGNYFSALAVPEPRYAASIRVNLCLGEHSRGNQGSGTTVLDSFRAVGPGPRIEVIAFVSRGASRYVAMWTYQEKTVEEEASYEWVEPIGEPAYWEVTEATFDTESYRLTILMGDADGDYKESYYWLGGVVPGGYLVSLEDPADSHSWADIDAPGYGVLEDDEELGDLVLKRVADEPIELGTVIDGLGVSNLAGDLFDHVVLTRRVYHEGDEYKTLRAEVHAYKGGVIVGIYTVPFTQTFDDDWEEPEDANDGWHAARKLCLRGASDNWIYFTLGYGGAGYMLNVNTGQMRDAEINKTHGHEYLTPEYGCDTVVAHGVALNSNYPTEGDLPDTLP